MCDFDFGNLVGELREKTTSNRLEGNFIPMLVEEEVLIYIDVSFEDQNVHFGQTVRVGQVWGDKFVAYRSMLNVGTFVHSEIIDLICQRICEFKH